MRDRKNSNSRQQGDWSESGTDRQQSQETNRDERQHGGGSRKQPQANRTHRSQQR